MDTHDNSLGRFSELALLILASLEDGPKHAAALKGSIEQCSEISIEPSSLYGASARLERRDWVAVLNVEGPYHSYRLTDSGEAVLQRHRAAMHEHRERIGLHSRGTLFKERSMRPITCILKLYPQAWRTRYETEMLALLETHNITFLTVFDLLFGALDARLDPYYRTEKTLFSFKSLHTATIAFIAALTIATFCMFFWHEQATALGSLSDGNGMGVSLSVVGYSYFVALYLTLFASTVLIAAVSLKRAITARRTGTVLLAVVCFAIPFVMIGLLIGLPPGISLSRLIEINTIRYICMVFGGLELLMCSLFMTITKAREAIATHKKRQLFLVGFVDLLLIFFGYYLYQVMFGYPGQDFSFDVFLAVMSALAISLFPFAGIGTLLLAVTGREMSRRTLRIALIPASMIALLMVVNLLASIGWELLYWAHSGQAMGLQFLFDGRLMVIASVVMAVATVIALAALGQGFMALTAPLAFAGEAAQPLTTMQQHHRNLANFSQLKLDHTPAFPLPRERLPR